jgi:histidine triad (HIT) family protein
VIAGFGEFMMECVFCDIIVGREPAEIVFENDRVVVFKDHRPQAGIHLLVCPKTHYPTFSDAPPEEIGYLLKVCRKMAETLDVKSGFRLMINNGPQGGQIVNHLHVHFLSWIKGLETKKLTMMVD